MTCYLPVSMRTLNLNKWLHYIQSIHDCEIDLGLARVASVAERVGQIHQFNIPVITIAGTNGKGSTIALLEATLIQSGFRVGVYTSPHLLQFQERIRINGINIQTEKLCDAFQQIEDNRGTKSLTYFEFVTLAALYIFQQSQLDIVLLEVGLGGRLDAVNVVSADIAVITSIGYDHTQWLGNTLLDIAKEKAGIFRVNQIAVCGHKQPLDSLVTHAQNLGTQLIMAVDDFGVVECNANRWSWYGINSSGNRLVCNELPLPNLALENAVIAKQVLQVLPLVTQESAFKDSLEKVFLPGRQQVVRGRCTIVVDVAHNQSAVEQLVKDIFQNPKPAIQNTVWYGNKQARVWAIFGAMADKDWQSMVTVLTEFVDCWVPVGIPVERALPVDHLKTWLQEQGYLIYSDIANPVDALNHVCNAAAEEDLVLVFGSFYLVSTLWSDLNLEPVHDHSKSSNIEK